MGVFSQKLHPFYSELFLYMAEECGLEADELKAGNDAFKGLKDWPGQDWYVRLLHKMLSMEKYQSQSVGFEYGRQLDFAAAGIIGQAVMTAPTLGESLNLMCRYYVLTGLDIDFSIEIHEEELRVYPVLNYDELDSVIETFIFEALISSWSRCAKQLVRRPPLSKRIELSCEAPSYADKYNQYTYGEVLFNRSKNMASLDVSVLDLPTISNNAFVHRRAVGYCEAALLKLGDTLTTHEKVKKQLRVLKTSSFVTVDSVANSLHLSPRTLIRRLQGEGYRFQELLDHHRYKTACRLLTNKSWNLEKIAEHLGYSDASNFRRAFKKWSGLTPREYRNKN